MTKEEIRAQYLQKRSSLSQSDFAKLDKQLYQQFFSSIDLSSIKTFHSFLSIRKFKEPDTLRIIERVRQDNSTIRIVVPKVDASTNSLRHYYYEGSDQLLESSWGIPEPKGGTEATTDSIDMVLVPLLAFDLTGFRVGYGKGYYDKFLSTCRVDCKKIGLSLFPPIEYIGPAEWYDVKLDQVVTPKKTFVF